MKKKLTTFALFVAALVAATVITVSFADAHPVAAMTPHTVAPAMVSPAPAMAPMVPAMVAPVVPVMAPVTTPAMTVAPATKKKSMTTAEIVDIVFKILGGILSLVLSVLGGMGYLKWAKGDRFKKVQKVIEMVFPAVEALAKRTENKIDDKVVEFLKLVNESLRKAGEPELTDSETAAAKDVASKKALAAKLKE